MRRMKMKKLFLIGAVAAMSFVPLVSSADDYPYIISGDPVAAATVGSCSAASSGKALVTDALTAASSSKPLEARFRTWLASLGTALRSDKWITGFMLFVR